LALFWRRKSGILRMWRRRMRMRRTLIAKIRLCTISVITPVIRVCIKSCSIIRSIWMKSIPIHRSKIGNRSSAKTSHSLLRSLTFLMIWQIFNVIRRRRNDCSCSNIINILFL
jgi:hypothetical protein